MSQTSINAFDGLIGTPESIRCFERTKHTERVAVYEHNRGLASIRVEQIDSTARVDFSIANANVEISDHYTTDVSTIGESLSELVAHFYEGDSV